MIGGIFETIGRTLGVGKEKYFLELDDAAEESVENVKAVVVKTAKVAVKTAKEVSADVTDKVQSLTGDATDTAESVADDAADKAKSAADKTKKAAKTAKAPAKKAAAKKSAKGASQKSEGSEQPDAPTPDAAPAKAEPRSPEEIIVSAIAAASKKTDENGNVADGPHNFATDHLMPLGNRGRRRPGPSLGAFKGMAKEVNPRLKG